MQGTPMVSVMLSAYNPESREHFMLAIQSIISQTFTDWEMILCDDGSDEKYLPLFREAKALDPRIRLIHNRKNFGLGVSMNHCIQSAKGKYLARMDADDISEPERLGRLVDFLEHHERFQWVGCNTALINDDGKWGIRMMPAEPGVWDFLHYSPYIHPSVMFRREVLEENGGYRPLRSGEDYELFMRLHSLGFRGANIHEALFDYREDRSNYRRRDFRYHLAEVSIRRDGFRRLGILHMSTLPYVIKPVIVAMLPYRLEKSLRKRLRSRAVR